MTVLSDAAVASERRQKADAILMCLSLLDSAAQGLRVEAENRSERRLGQISGRALKIGSAISSINRGFCKAIWISGFLTTPLNWRRLGENAKIFTRIEWTRHKTLAGPGLRQWQRYRNQTRIAAISVELVRSSLSRFCISKGRAHSQARLAMGPANPIPHR
jgi:hypothetical protein